MRPGAVKAVITAALIALFCVIYFSIKLYTAPDECNTYINPDGIVVSWSGSDTVLYYNLYRQDADGLWELIAENVDAESYTDGDVESGVVYTYSVQAVLMNGIKSAFSIESGGNQTLTYYEMPVFTAALNEAGGVYVEWIAVTDAESYIIYRKTSGQVWNEIAEDVTDNFYLDEEAESSETYSYTVKAVYEDGTQGTFNSTGISAEYLAAPEIEEIESYDEGIELTWEEVEGADSYIIYRHTDESDDFEELDQTDETSYDDEDVEDGTEYTYVLQAVSEDGTESALSAEEASETWEEPEPETTAAASSSSSGSSSSGSSSGSSSAIVSPVDDDEPYVRASGYYQITYSISYSAGYDISTSDYNMGLKVIKVKEYLVSAGYLTKSWDKGTDAWSLYNSAAASAVSKWQSDNGLSSTGVVDINTWLAMGFSESDWYNLGAYVTPIKVNSESTRSDYIEAMVSTAESYLSAGTAYGGGCSGSPGSAADCSGLIIQCLYAAGINPTSVSVVTHSQSSHLYGSRDLGNDSKLGITVSSPERGDLVFYYNSSGVITHVALYVGDGYVIESQTYSGVIKRSMWSSGSRHKYVRIFW